MSRRLSALALLSACAPAPDPEGPDDDTSAADTDTDTDADTDVDTDTDTDTALHTALGTGHTGLDTSTPTGTASHTGTPTDTATDTLIVALSADDGLCWVGYSDVCTFDFDMDGDQVTVTGYGVPSFFDPPPVVRTGIGTLVGTGVADVEAIAAALHGEKLLPLYGDSYYGNDDLKSVTLSQNGVEAVHQWYSLSMESAGAPQALLALDVLVSELHLGTRRCEAQARYEPDPTCVPASAF